MMAPANISLGFFSFLSVKALNLIVIRLPLLPIISLTDWLLLKLGSLFADQKPEPSHTMRAQFVLCASQHLSPSLIKSYIVAWIKAASMSSGSDASQLSKSWSDIMVAQLSNDQSLFVFLVFFACPPQGHKSASLSAIKPLVDILSCAITLA